MSVCVHMSVYMYVYIYIYVHMCVYKCVCVHMYVYIHVYIFQLIGLVGKLYANAKETRVQSHFESHQRPKNVT